MSELQARCSKAPIFISAKFLSFRPLNRLSVYLSVRPSVRSSIHPSIHPPISASTALVDLGRFFSFLIYTQLVGLLGRGISPSQGRYLHTEQHKHRINAHTDIHASSGIRTHDSSVREGEDGSCPRLRDHCDQLTDYYNPQIIGPISFKLGAVDELILTIYV
jgi:hypothetical protein